MPNEIEKANSNLISGNNFTDLILLFNTTEAKKLLIKNKTMLINSNVLIEWFRTML